MVLLAFTGFCWGSRYDFIVASSASIELLAGAERSQFLPVFFVDSVTEPR